MFKIMLSSIVVVTSATSYAHTTQVLNGYWQYDEYLKSNPAQKQLTDVLSEIVRNDPAPIILKQDKPVSIAVVYPGNKFLITG